MIQISKLKTIEIFLKDYSPSTHIIIDVRSESEFAEDHLLGAVNLPVLNNNERAKVGTEYKKNPFTARQLGAKLIAGNLKQNLEMIEGLILKFNNTNAEQHKPFCQFVIYCWRGGMRSRSLFTVMDLIGYKTSIIDGGYQSYRRFVNDFFNKKKLPEVTSIYGPSGSGKSELISNLISEGKSAIHLEKYANHRGSLLGGDPNLQPSQKLFESNLFQAISKMSDRPVIAEGESKKIGRLLIPEKFYQAMISGKKIWVELPIELRAMRIAEEYDFSNEFILHKLQYLKKFIEGKIFSSIAEAIAANDRYTAAYLLLKHHYDKHYLLGSPDKGSERKYDAIIKAMSFEYLNKQVLDFFQSI